MLLVIKAPISSQHRRNFEYKSIDANKIIILDEGMNGVFITRFL